MIKKIWACLFIPKKTPYCHHDFKEKYGLLYAKPCKYWCLKNGVEYCKLLKKELSIQDQIKGCGINVDY